MMFTLCRRDSQKGPLIFGSPQIRDPEPNRDPEPSQGVGLTGYGYDDDNGHDCRAASRFQQFVIQLAGHQEALDGEL